MPISCPGGLLCVRRAGSLPWRGGPGERRQRDGEKHRSDRAGAPPSLPGPLSPLPCPRALTLTSDSEISLPEKGTDRCSGLFRGTWGMLFHKSHQSPLLLTWPFGQSLPAHEGPRTVTARVQGHAARRPCHCSELHGHRQVNSPGAWISSSIKWG